ncbi:MAG: MarR family winged helix-turn-helix transcriptional regulator [Rickettsiales bacterium]|nr:MarR family winged helix-turn-helix transcriptional regulator [Rickettsiales bacterium]
MTEVPNTIDALNLWHRIISRTLKELPYDLSARQMAVLGTVYLTDPPHTVRNLSERLNISKPAICRAVDTLSMMELIKRKKDEQDRRNVFIQRTVNGSVFLSDFGDLILSELSDNAPDSHQVDAPAIDRARVATS